MQEDVDVMRAPGVQVSLEEPVGVQASACQNGSVEGCDMQQAWNVKRGLPELMFFSLICLD
jgi:hypothetical protein